MNYLIVTFDGLGDGVIYYPIFKEIGEKMPESLFFYTTNLFFSGNPIQGKIQTPSNFKIIDNNFRKFSKDYWKEISMFLEQNDIKVVINLRTVGRRFEKGYYDFKDWFATQNSEINFYDDETLTADEKINTNIRDIVLKILQRGTNQKLIYDTSIFKSLFPIIDNPESILINMHSGGVFKLWEVTKWVKLISSLVLSDRNVEIYEGFSENEKLYTKKVISDLPGLTKNKIKKIRPANLYKLEESLRDIFLLISVDSGLIHLCDSMGIKSLGIYVTTSPLMWGGSSNQFNYVSSKHMLSCKNFYPFFGMCMNGKKKCDSILFEKDDINIDEVLEKVNQIYYEKN
ncbi:MAG: glycosyltransferase family 9 protein [bacterium]